MTKDTNAEALALARSTIENQMGGQRAHILSKALIEQAQKIERLRVVMAALLANPTSELMKNIARTALKETK